MDLAAGRAGHSAAALAVLRAVLLLAGLRTVIPHLMAPAVPAAGRVDNAVNGDQAGSVRPQHRSLPSRWDWSVPGLIKAPNKKRRIGVAQNWLS